MTAASPDDRSPRRKLLDEQIAAEAHTPIPELPADAEPSPMEEHLRRLRRQPQAFVGFVENGLIRFADPDTKLPERSRVIIVAA